MRSLRSAAGLADLTAFSKLEIHGAAAVAFIERVSSNRLPKKIGSISLTYFLNPNGRIEGEATLLRLAQDRFYAVYAAVREKALLDWLEEQRRDSEAVAFDNLSERYSVLMLAGPGSRAILGSCTDAALDNGSFRWLSGRRIAVAAVENVRAMRMTYIGELGWELHIPNSGMRAVYDALAAAGEPLGMVHVGSAALNAMRMEKGYKSGHELTNEVTLAEADLVRFARLSGFQGAEASLAEPKKRRLACLQLAEPSGAKLNADPLGSESVWAKGEYVGSITSGGFGYGVNAYLAWAYVMPAFSAPGTELEVMVLGEPRRARVLAEPAWDAENARPRAGGRLAVE